LLLTCFDHFFCERVQCVYNKNNHASRRVCEKLGLKKEGELAYFEGLPKKMREDGASHLAVMTALTRKDLPNITWLSELRKLVKIEI